MNNNSHAVNHHMHSSNGRGGNNNINDVRDGDDHSEGNMSFTSTSDARSQSHSEGTHSTGSFSLAKNETQAVKYSKVLVIIVLTAAACAVGFLTYHLLSGEEQDDFENQFYDFCIEISELVHHEARTVFLSVQGMSTTITSFALETNAVWPMVTIPHFEVRGVGANKFANSLMTAFTPLVNSKTRKLWEAYSVKNQAWIQDGVEYNIELHMDFIEDGTFIAEPIPEHIFRFSNETTTETTSTDHLHNEFKLSNEHYYDESYGPYLPVWQLAPAPHEDSIINFNLLSHPVFTNVFHGMLHTGRPVLSPIVHLEWLYGGSVRDDANHPHSFLLQPVYRNFQDEDDHEHKEDEENEVLSSKLKNKKNKEKNTNANINKGQNNNLTLAQEEEVVMIVEQEVQISQEEREDYERLAEELDIVGFVISVLPWDNYFKNLLPEYVQGIHVVLEDTCNDTYTYILNGMEAEYVGVGDLHDPEYDDLQFTTEFAPFAKMNVSKSGEHCEFFINLYPTSILEDKYTTNKPILFTIVMLLVFFFTSMVFILYDFLVQRRQDKVMATAKRSNAIVSSLFPSNVRDRIMKDAEEQVEAEMKAKSRGTRFAAAKSKLKDFLEEDNNDEHMNNANNDGNNDKGDMSGMGSAGVYGSKPIADLFPNATVLFADIVGFTAWSSVREPSQVFQLLETLYHAFDEIAKRRRVFKVETIGDCYVAVTGLPEPRADHAVVMARFARDCLSKMNDLSKKLEVTLGPDTGDLSMRVGLNSGPVTAGVLRGEKSRFQLFGDTVNTAARMESNGERNRIHMSQETAELLIGAGKSHWVKAREEKVFAKGKGELQTYWLELKLQSSPSTRSGTSQSSDADGIPLVGLGTSTNSSNGTGAAGGGGTGAGAAANLEDNKKASSKQSIGSGSTRLEKLREDVVTENNKPLLSDKVERLVSWNADVLLRLIKQIVARRNAAGIVSETNVATISTGHNGSTYESQHTVIDEVKEIITLPKFDAKVAKKQEDNLSKVQLDPDVTTQLRDYVTIIATMYRENAFHNFEHASHVTMSVVKLLSRIVAPDEILHGGGVTEGTMSNNNNNNNETGLEKNLHDHTYGITSDPLTQFAVVFSALIHDVDHSGVPNAQLVKENASIATIYNNKSVAEQNSVDIAWDLLMDDSFTTLRSAIYANATELKRFRQLVVNTVMATDIVDKELKQLRNQRWETAFDQERIFVDYSNKQTLRDDVNRKATIVIEHLIQASDVAHTMQHWHIYRKWNERFFEENLHAYRAGRAVKDPTEFWYKGEIGFFDFYIIPLAKKLKECGVFGVSSDEYLNYAMTNRKEWELKGEQVVAEMVTKYSDKKFDYNNNQCQLGDAGDVDECRSSAFQK